MEDKLKVKDFKGFPEKEVRNKYENDYGVGYKEGSNDMIDLIGELEIPER